MSILDLLGWGKLPKGTRYYDCTLLGGGIYSLIVEYKPTVRSVLCGNSKYIRHLSFPYAIFILTYTQIIFKKKYRYLQLGFRNTKLTNTSDFIYLPPMPNVYPSYMVCMGDDYKAESRCLHTLYDKVINDFWGSSFDGAYSGGYWPDNHGRSFDKWAGETEKDPNFAMKFNWNDPLHARRLCDIAYLINDIGMK